MKLSELLVSPAHAQNSSVADSSEFYFIFGVVLLEEVARQDNVGPGYAEEDEATQLRLHIA
jgi:hypothetical protein